MRKLVRQRIKSYTKLNHIHFCAVAFKAKDIQNFVRHFLFHMNNSKNEPQCVQTLLSTIVGLTGWCAKAISNSITRLVSEGEFERVDSHTIRLNHDIANRSPWHDFSSNYGGKEVAYNEAQDKLILKLKALTKEVSSLPRDKQDFEHTEQLTRDLEMSALIAKVDELSVAFDEQKRQLNDVLDLLKAMVNKEPGAEQKAECHLKLIDGGLE